MGAEEAGLRPSEEIPEHVALINFANRLGSSITKNEVGDEQTVRKEASLLMSLVSFTPHVVAEPSDSSSGASTASSASAASDQYVSSDQYLSDSSIRRDSFLFSCPSLSLDRNEFKRRGDQPRRVSESGKSSHLLVPADLFRRALKVDDRDALRLSAVSMARNLLVSFRKAIEWRIQAWSGSLSASLARKKRTLQKNVAPESETKKLMHTGEAKLLLKLQDVKHEINVLHVATSFHVLSQRLMKEDENDQPPSMVGESSELLQAETEYQYRVSYALEMEGTINIQTPAGYNEISVKVPGSIEGTFLSSEPGAEDLIAVHVELETDFLAAMVEKGCRIVVRAAVESLLSEPVAMQPETPVADETTSTPSRAKLTPRLPTTKALSSAVVVTPHDKKVLIQGKRPNSSLLSIPEDLDVRSTKDLKYKKRRFQPQSSLPLAPRTPRSTSPPESLRPSMVSPPPGMSEFCDDKSIYNSPKFPLLCEAACKAMDES